MTDRGGGERLDPLLVRAVRSRIWLILAIVIVGAAAGALIALATKSHYASQAAVLTRAPQFDPARLGVDVGAPATSAQRDAATARALAQLPAVRLQAQRTLRRRGASDAADAAGDATVSSPSSSDLVVIRASADTPLASAAAANTLAATYVAVNQAVQRAAIASAQAAATRAIAQLRAQRGRLPGARGAQLNATIDALRAQADRLQGLSALATGGSVLAERAGPGRAESRHVPRSAAIGAGAGLLLALAFALLRERLDRRLTNSRDLGEAFDLPVLARVPRSKALDGNRLPGALPPTAAEAFRMLRANLTFYRSAQDFRSLVITSAAVDDGKTTVAFNLAATFAATGMSVLLIEADIRKPTLAGMLHLPPNYGLSMLLDGRESSIIEIAHQVPVAPGANGTEAAETLNVVLAGRMTERAGEMLASDRMRHALREAESAFDLVIVDTAPPTVVADAIPLMTEVGAVIVVGRVGRLSVSDARRVREQLDRVDAPTIGIVANFSPVQDGGRYAAGYGREFG